MRVSYRKIISLVEIISPGRAENKFLVVTDTLREHLRVHALLYMFGVPI